MITSEAATPGEADVDRRPVTAVLIGNVISLTGDALAAVAVPWFVLETTGSAARAGLVGGIAVLPAFLSGIFGGTVVDRLGPRRASVVADIVSGVAIMMIPLLYATVGLAFWQLLVLVLLGGALDVPGLTARRSMLPELARLGGVRLERASSVLEGNQQLAFLIGPPLAGVAIGAIGAERVLWVDAASFAISAGVVARLVPGHLHPPRRRDVGSRYLDELRAGLRFLWEDRVLRAASLSLAATNGIGAPFSALIYVVYARDRFDGATFAGLVFSAMGLGALLGALAFGAYTHRYPRRWTWVIAYLSFPLTNWLFATELPPWVMLATLFALSLVGGAVNPLLVTVRMERIPPELRGRVFATTSAIALAVQPLGILVGGLMIEGLGLRTTVLILAGVGQVAGVATTLHPVWSRLDESRPERVAA